MVGGQTGGGWLKRVVVHQNGWWMAKMSGVMTLTDSVFTDVICNSHFD